MELPCAEEEIELLMAYAGTATGGRGVFSKQNAAFF